jgi:hypothetical protein
VFSYYDGNGHLLTTNPLTADDLARVSSLDITLKVQTNTVQSSAPTNTIVQRVSLPNGKINVFAQP